MRPALRGVTAVGLSATGCSSVVPTDTLDLQATLLSDPQNDEARLALALGALERGLPAQALLEFLVLERRGKLNALATKELATLLRKRGQLRLAVEDPLAIVDMEHSRRLTGSVSDKLSPLFEQAYALSAVASLRHSSRFERDKAVETLAKLGESANASLLQDHQNLLPRSQDELLELSLWFRKGGAKRHQLRVLRAYVKRGGRQADAVRQWHALHHWWYGDSRAALPSEAADMAVLPSAVDRFNDRRVAVEAAQQITDSPLASWLPPELLPGVLRVANAYAQDPALAARRAREFVDSSVYGAMEMMAMAELFYRIGDLQRAKTWTDALAELSPGMPSYAMGASLGCMAIGEVDRAKQWLVRAAASSGDPGYWWALGAIALRKFGHPLAAIAAGRQALDLRSAGEDLHILLEIGRSQVVLGRTADARETMATLRRRLGQDAESALTGVRPISPDDTQAPKTLLGLVGHPFDR